MYHRINNSVGDKLQPLTVSVASFEKQLSYYKENIKFLNWMKIVLL